MRKIEPITTAGNIKKYNSPLTNKNANLKSKQNNSTKTFQSILTSEINNINACTTPKIVKEKNMKSNVANRWYKYPDEMPPDIPEEEQFGIEYVIEYKLPSGKTEKMITEWLYDKKWNCQYPVLRWKEYQPIVPFKPKMEHNISLEKYRFK